jgi:methylenetetrahydrofolate--tRNA-(uracil-5-)-methyltransferase
LFFAGQITGVEGYVESAASGLVAGINAGCKCDGRPLLIFPPETAHGALAAYITATATKNFQPMNITFGLFPPLGDKVRDKKKRNAMLAERALSALAGFTGA